jgi:hypothetical protein
MSKRIWRPLNTYGLVFIGLVAFTVIGYQLAIL